MDERDDRGRRPPAEGVRIIGAEEAQAALEAGQAAGRRPDDELRFGDVPPAPPGPRPPHRFPLPDFVDPAEAVPRPPVVNPRRFGGAGARGGDDGVPGAAGEPATSEVPATRPGSPAGAGDGSDPWAPGARQDASEGLPVHPSPSGPGPVIYDPSRYDPVPSADDQGDPLAYYPVAGPPIHDMGGQQVRIDPGEPPPAGRASGRGEPRRHPDDRSFDDLSYDPVSYDPASHDPASHDPASHDPASHDPA
ncbi:MAG: hypothetical protein ACRDY0_11830, partial [Acidimicrobiales bacterium]